MLEAIRGGVFHGFSIGPLVNALYKTLTSPSPMLQHLNILTFEGVKFDDDDFD